MTFMRACRTTMAVLMMMTAGCVTTPENPSFPVSIDQAHQAIDAMRVNPKPLPRPLVIIGGFLDLDVSPPLFEHYFRGLTGPGKIVTVSVGQFISFDACRQHVLDLVDRECPCTDPLWTAEVDVIGASLGGLVARYSAAPSLDPAHPRRLRIARLFSISSPHSGAKLAETAGFLPFHKDMRPGSAFLKSLAEADAQATYELYPYVRLGDFIVGAKYAAPPGVIPFWVPNQVMGSSHLGAMMDPRILADIGRRLRGEEPLTRLPRTPLPAISVTDLRDNMQCASGVG